MKKRFKELLSKQSGQDMIFQKENLKLTNNKWQADNIQLDDMLIVGIKV